MDDLLERFGRQVREAVAAGSDADHLAGVRRRAARRRSRRAGAVVTGVLVAVALVITVVVTGGGAGGPPVRVAVGGTAPAPAAVAGPAGWQAHDVGEARVWVPSDWAVASSGQASCPSGGGLLTEGSGHEGRCAPDPVVASIVSLTTTTAPEPAGGRTLTVNGYGVIEAHPSIDGGRSYDIPDLHAQLTLHGPVPAGVLASVGPSPLGRALIGVVQGSAPAGWQPVRYQGVEVMVPPGWSVLGGDQLPPCRLDPFAPTHPDAYVGTDDIIYNCPLMPVGSTSPPAAGVWLRQAEGPADSALPTLRFVDGAVRLDTASASAAAPLFDLQYDGVVVTIGLGPDPTVARAILGSIRTTGDPATAIDGSCRSITAPTMPAPQRLPRPLTLGGEAVSLRPPDPSDRAVVGATQAWGSTPKTDADGSYLLYLARASTHPADGSQAVSDVLAWVEYFTPVTTATAGACGQYSVTLVDAGTGQDLGTLSYRTGP